jgi:hypothetical protein
MKANGTAKLIAGGYNKATAMDADSVANRVLIFQYPNKEAEPWEMSPQVRKVADFHTSASKVSNRNELQKLGGANAALFGFEAACQGVHVGHCHARDVV